MKHLNEDTIQAFLDGELHDAQMSWATEHLALCERCTNALIRAESEVAEINLAFAAERAEGVPTQRVWARIENEIDLLSVQQSHSKAGTKSFWQNLGAFFTPAQIAFTGSLAGIVLISLFALSVLNQQQDTNRENNIAYQDYQYQPPTARSINRTQEASIQEEKIREEARPQATSEPDSGLINNSNVLKASYKPSTVKQAVKSRESEVSSKLKIQKPKSEEATPLLEEKEYLTSIAQLSKAVSSSDEIIMRPSFRVEYESNIAMMDKVISETQKQARRNPNDENAKRALFASYQNKIDLLNTVAEKTQLMATVR